MNAKEFEAMRRRLHARRVGEEDHPVMLALAGVGFVLLFIVVNFI